MSNVINPAEAEAISHGAPSIPDVKEEREIVFGRHFLIDAALVIGWILGVDWLVYQIGRSKICFSLRRFITEC